MGGTVGQYKRLYSYASRSLPKRHNPVLQFLIVSKVSWLFAFLDFHFLTRKKCEVRASPAPALMSRRPGPNPNPNPNPCSCPGDQLHSDSGRGTGSYVQGGTQAKRGT